MVCDALIKADPYLPIPDGKGGATRMSQAMADPASYVHLKDSVLDLIESSPPTHPDMVEAQAIIKRIRSRDLYKCVLAIDADGMPLWDLTDSQIMDEICAVSEKVVRRNLDERLSRPDIPTPEKSSAEFNAKVCREWRGGREGGVGSMMTYKTAAGITIMRVAGSATSAMRKPQTPKRVRNDEAC
jgi:hypothetical protein